jgi:transcriptional regulator with XRE-family HTH domain
MSDTYPTCGTCREPWTPDHVCTSGADLAKERESAGLTKAELARRMGISKQYLGRIETQPYPSAETKTRYRAALKGTK